MKNMKNMKAKKAMKYTEQASHLENFFQQIKKMPPKKVFMHFEDRQFTYQELISLIEKTAAFYQGLRLQQGDRLLIITDQEEYAASLFLTALLNGLCPVLISTDVKQLRRQMIIEQLQPAVIFFEKINDQAVPADLGPSRLITIERVQATSKFKDFFFSATKSNHKTTPLESSNSYPALLSSFFPQQMPFLKLHGSHGSHGNHGKETSLLKLTSHILYTSGSTSSPKGVEHTHKSLFSHLHTLKRIYGYDEKSVVFNNINFSHSDGLCHGLMICAFTGATLVRMRPFSMQSLEQQLNGLCRYQVTHFLTMPTVLAWIDQWTTEKDYFAYPRFQHLISVAGKLDEHLWKKINDRFQLKVCNMYGLTETISGGIFCGPHPETFQLGTVGLPEDIDISLHPPGQKKGELLLRGDCVFRGYYKNPQATAEVFHQGWFKTGDLVEITETGHLKVVGRCKSVIISGGRNIEPDEVNEVYQQHPQVAFCSTLGIADEMMGQRVVSAIELKSGYIDEATLIQFGLLQLETYKVPKKIYFFDRLPRGHSGKVVLPELEALILERENLTRDREKTAHLNSHFSENHQFQNQEEKRAARQEQVLELAAKCFKMPLSQLSLESSNQDILLWDSIGHLNFVVELENTFGLQLDLNEIMAIENLKQAYEISLRKT